MTSTGKSTEDRIEAIAREAYDSCHRDDTFAALTHRSRFSKEDYGLLQQWLAFARAEAGAPEADAPVGADGYGPQPS